MTDIADRLLGLPVIYNRNVPKGMAYLINKNQVLIIGTWWKRPTVRSIIASQRKRRHK